MAEFKDRAKNMAESAQDIARDKLDSFRKLNNQQQLLLIVFAGIAFVVLLVWLFWPGKMDVFIDRILMDGIMDNQVVIENRENKSMKKLKVILNDNYIYEIPQLDPEKPLPIKVTEFRPIGNPDGSPPGSNTIPRKVEVKARGARVTKEFQ